MRATDGVLPSHQTTNDRDRGSGMAGRHQQVQNPSRPLAQGVTKERTENPAARTATRPALKRSRRTALAEF